MKVTVKRIAGPQIYKWVDVPGATAAQSVEDPDNIVLKVSNGVALRLSTNQHGAMGTIQNPGEFSQWYKCEVSVVITPAIQVNHG